MTSSVPRISANELGRFAFGTASVKKAIARSQKHPRANIVGRFNIAQAALLRTFDGKAFSKELLDTEIERLKKLKPLTKFQNSAYPANLTALCRFEAIRELSLPMEGKHTIVRSNASFIFDGVEISVRPDIVTVDENRSAYSFLKFRFSKSKYSWDASEIVLLLLKEFGKTYFTKQLSIDAEHTKLIDCFSARVFHCNNISSFKSSMLRKAITEYRSIWHTTP